jgi:hypothetical protein
MIRFIDMYKDGIVYLGTKEHMHGLSREGGYPREIGPEPVLEADGQVWKVIKAPDHWALNDNDFSHLWEKAEAPKKV